MFLSPPSPHLKATASATDSPTVNGDKAEVSRVIAERHGVPPSIGVAIVPVVAAQLTNRPGT
jgi:hypothetical protein